MSTLELLRQAGLVFQRLFQLFLQLCDVGRGAGLAIHGARTETSGSPTRLPETPGFTDGFEIPDAAGIGWVLRWVLERHLFES